MSRQFPAYIWSADFCSNQPNSYVSDMSRLFSLCFKRVDHAWVGIVERKFEFHKIPPRLLLQMMCVETKALWWPGCASESACKIWTCPADTFDCNFQNVLDLCADPFEYDAFIYNADAKQKTCYACSTGHEYEGTFFNFGELLSKSEIKHCNFSFAELNYTDYIREPGAAFGRKRIIRIVSHA